jgi:lambda family phage tail tape measure protein
MALAMNRIVPGNMQASVSGLRSEWIGLQNAPTDKLINAISQMATGGAVAPSTSNARAPITGGQVPISAIPNKFKVPGPPVSAIRGQMATLNANDNRIKKEAIALQEKLNALGEDAALQRVLEAAKGENTVKQKQRELALIEAEANSIGVMAGDKQAIATFDAKSLETQKQIEEENKRILKNTRLQGKEKENLAEATRVYLENAKASLAVDRQMLQVQQQMRFNSEMAAMQLEFQNRGAGAKAGFFGAAAQAYNQELTTGSGDPAKAAEKARQTRMNEVNDQIVSMRENLLMLQDPTYQVTESAKAIGGAFSDSFKGIVAGSATAQESLANFFQRTSDHFLDMAAQMLTQQLVLKLIGFGMNLFTPGANALGGAGANFQMPGQAFMPTGSYGFAKGGVFTNSVVSSPTLFKFANGGALSNGVMGEAGPEAIMPLTRGPGGRLGVDASGSGGGVSVTVNVDAKSSSVEGDDKRSSELGRVIAVAVQQELIKQKRSGGILTK